MIIDNNRLLISYITVCIYYMWLKQYIILLYVCRMFPHQDEPTADLAFENRQELAPQMAMPWRPLQMRWVRDPRFYNVNAG